MNSIQKENPLGYEKPPRLLKSFAIPSIIAMLVSSLYNIVDQVFIGQGVGYLGNAATNVAFPLTTISLAIALLIGIGSASLFSLNLGAGKKEDAAQVVGTAFTMMLVFGVIYAVLIEIFLVPLLTAFGATAEIMPYAKEYTRITAIGMPFLIVNNGMSNLARADGSPKFSMTCMLIGAIINTILDQTGSCRCCVGNDHRTDCILSGCRQLFKAIPKCGTKSALFPASQKALFKNRFPRHEQQFKSGSAHICTDRTE